MAAGCGPGKEMRRERAIGIAALLCCLLASSCGRQQPAAFNELVTSLGIPMVLIPAGSFRMGSDRGRSDESPRHEVSISAFAMDKFEVTQDVYGKLQLPDPSQFKGRGHPIEQVRWSDAAMFCNERSRAEGLEPCYDEDDFHCDFNASGYRLPTEAEWEYACRGGDDRDPGRPTPGRIGSRACYAGNSGGRTQPVGRRRANAWGVHDLLGNVLEWCHDVYDEGYYENSAGRDPRGPAESPKKDRVLRGGSWKTKVGDITASRRYHGPPGIADACFARNTYGFRCVRRPGAAERQAGGK